MTLSIRRKKLIKINISMYVLLGIFILSTNPRELPIILLIAPVIWLFFCLSISFYALLHWKTMNNTVLKRQDTLYAFGGAGIICTVLLLRSVNQLNGRDILLAGILLLISGLYAKKLRPVHDSL